MYKTCIIITKCTESRLQVKHRKLHQRIKTTFPPTPTGYPSNIANNHNKTRITAHRVPFHPVYLQKKKICVGIPIVEIETPIIIIMLFIQNSTVLFNFLFTYCLLVLLLSKPIRIGEHYSGNRRTQVRDIIQAPKWSGGDCNPSWQAVENSWTESRVQFRAESGKWRARAQQRYL